MAEMRLYLEKTEVEQQFRLHERIPSVDEYWQYRLGTSAVGPGLCLNE